VKVVIPLLFIKGDSAQNFVAFAFFSEKLGRAVFAHNNSHYFCVQFNRVLKFVLFETILFY